MSTNFVAFKAHSRLGVFPMERGKTRAAPRLAIGLARRLPRGTVTAVVPSYGKAYNKVSRGRQW